LLLFEEFWAESHQYETLLSQKFQKEMEKLSNKNPEQYEHVLKKIREVRMNPTHYKPLSGDLHGAKRAHIGDFVLIYELKDNKMIFHDYGHHDHIYEANLKS
jgi:YafQ family addiction module toxin component